MACQPAATVEPGSVHERCLGGFCIPDAFIIPGLLAMAGLAYAFDVHHGKPLGQLVMALSIPLAAMNVFGEDKNFPCVNT